MKILISDAADRFGNQKKLANALGVFEQAITNRKRLSEYLPEVWALKLHKRHPVITRELLAKARDRK